MLMEPCQQNTGNVETYFAREVYSLVSCFTCAHQGNLVWLLSPPIMPLVGSALWSSILSSLRPHSVGAKTWEPRGKTARVWGQTNSCLIKPPIFCPSTKCPDNIQLTKKSFGRCLNSTTTLSSSKIKISFFVFISLFLFSMPIVQSHFVVLVR